MAGLGPEPARDLAVSRREAWASAGLVAIVAVAVRSGRRRSSPSRAPRTPPTTWGSRATCSRAGAWSATRSGASRRRRCPSPGRRSRSGCRFRRSSTRSRWRSSARRAWAGWRLPRSTRHSAPRSGRRSSRARSWRCSPGGSRRMSRSNARCRPGRARTLALGTGLTVAVYLPLVLHSALPDSTMPFAALVLAVCLLAGRLARDARRRARDARVGADARSVAIRSAPVQPAPVTWRDRRVLAIGVLLGVAALTRNEAIWLALGWVGRRPRDRRGPARGWIRLVAAAAVPAMIVYAPWAIRDWLTFGSPLRARRCHERTVPDGPRHLRLGGHADARPLLRCRPADARRAALGRVRPQPRQRPAPARDADRRDRAGGAAMDRSRDGAPTARGLLGDHVRRGNAPLPRLDDLGHLPPRGRGRAGAAGRVRAPGPRRAPCRDRPAAWLDPTRGLARRGAGDCRRCPVHGRAPAVVRARRRHGSRPVRGPARCASRGRCVSGNPAASPLARPASPRPSSPTSRSTSPRPPGSTPSRSPTSPRSPSWTSPTRSPARTSSSSAPTTTGCGPRSRRPTRSACDASSPCRSRPATRAARRLRAREIPGVPDHLSVGRRGRGRDAWRGTSAWSGKSPISPRVSNARVEDVQVARTSRLRRARPQRTPSEFVPSRSGGGMNSTRQPTESASQVATKATPVVSIWHRRRRRPGASAVGAPRRADRAVRGRADGSDRGAAWRPGNGNRASRRPRIRRVGGGP